MSKILLSFVFLACLSISEAFWRLNQLPDLVHHMIKNEEPRKIIDIMSNAHHSIENSVNKEANFLKNILRVGMLQTSSGVSAEPGHAVNCGPPSHNFTLTWDPKEPEIKDNVKINFNMVSPQNFEKGSLQLSVFMEETLILKDQLDFCATSAKIGLTCPFSKGQKIVDKYTFSNMGMIPPATYKLLMKVLDDKSDVFLCAEVDVKIRP